MTKPLPFWIRRLIAATFCVMLAIYGLFMFLYLLTDLDSPTLFDKFCFGILCLAAWPFVIWAFILGEHPLIFLPLAISTTGLFWAFFLQLLFRWKDRRKGKNSN